MHENYFSVCLQHKEHVPLIIQISQSKTSSYISGWTIQSPTSRHCYFCQLKFFKNLCYRYYLLYYLVMLQLHGAIYRPNSFVLMLHYCVNLKAIRYESTSLNRIVADKSYGVIVA